MPQTSSWYRPKAVSPAPAQAQRGLLSCPMITSLLTSLTARTSGAGVPGSPPLVLESTFCLTGAVERVELRHVLVREREVEDLHVLRDPLAVRRLRDQRNVALDAPAEQHLGRRAPEA